MPLEELRPHAAALVDSLRSMGYTPAAAIADLVDNSITAKGRTIQVYIAVTNGDGYVSVEDDGTGLSEAELWECMRWGGAGPERERTADDLGRFGLGMKTASVSMGQVLTVASRKSARAPLNILSWDLRDVIKTGKWYPTKDTGGPAAAVLKRSRLATDLSATGTIVIVTELDRIGTRAALPAQADRNEATLLSKIRCHLGMVFHRFIEDGLTVRLGASAVASWDPFEGGVLRDSEMIGGPVKVTSYVMAHHSKVTTEEFERMGGPLGWGGHQGFLIYRARRLIVPGGWLRLFPARESVKLARIRIELPNSMDAAWGLNVMKSSVIPPSWVMADLHRIGEATRRQAALPFRFRGDRQAPPESTGNGSDTAFWKQISTEDAVRFRINRAHPVVQALKHAMKDPAMADAFLAAFERLLPLEAILQDPKRTTNGSGLPPDREEFAAALQLARHAVKLLRSQGCDRESAIEVVLSSEPFCWHADELGKELE